MVARVERVRTADVTMELTQAMHDVTDYGHKEASARHSGANVALLLTLLGASVGCDHGCSEFALSTG